MKLATLLFVCFVSTTFVQAMDLGDAKEKWMAIANVCIASTGASQDDILKLMKHEPIDSREGKCLFSCMLEKMGVVSCNQRLFIHRSNLSFSLQLKGSALDRESVMEHAKEMTGGDPEKMQFASAIVDECGHLSDPDECEAGVMIGTCFIKTASKKDLKFGL